MVLFSSHGPKGFPLDLPGLVVQEDPDEHKNGASGAKDGDLVAEDDDAEPNRQGMFDCTGNTEEEMRVVTLTLTVNVSNSCPG